ncbi:MAG TPA: alanine--tRNA ligase [Anaerolineales bacterium]|nr:alanine--tRNA ligase [Anaerolineales bacterium]
MGPKKLSGAEIRQIYIDFFVQRRHTAVPSMSLVPGGDSTLLFTNSGMVQFKDVFLGTDKRPYTRAVDSQKCMRVAGKHNDLDDVGRDDTHHTFFEMLGNWSFGDYYKKEAIEWAWQLLTEVWGLDKNRLYATVFKDDKGDIPTDEEAAANWLKQPGFDSSHLFYSGRKDNFWEMAETGPCGPCSEMHFDLGPDEGKVTQETLDTDRFVELWNLVFIQYNRISPTQLDPLPAKHVDTGMGFERLVSILQGVDSNYKTDLFTKSLEVLRSLTGHTEKEMLADFTPYRVICDHARTASFLVADGVVPGNVGRNYVTRMIIRRAARFGTKIGLHEPFLAKVAEAVIATYGSFYPELEKSRGAILDNLTREEIRFARTVETGTAHLEDLLSELGKQKKTVLDGRRAFDLYATYGLPFEISRDIAREQGLEVDQAGFDAARDEHSVASGGGKAMGKMGGEDAEFFAGILKDLQKKKKLGERGVAYDPYTSPRVEGEVLALIANGQPVPSVSFGDQVEVILPRTGFYIESGGQVDDTGYLRGQDWEIEITAMRRTSAGVIVHIGEVISGQPKVGDQCVAEVDMARRHDIMRNHTATHLMHAALHQVLGPHAVQAGSLVAPDRLRFDFNHPEAMTPEQIERVEQIVNDAVAADYRVTPISKPREEAIKEGAMALFGEKYGETVRTITVGDVDDKYSYELCGGTHLERTSDVGAFIIVSEGSAAAGVRRIEAVTGRGAYELIARRFRALKQTASALKSSVDDVPQKVESLLEEVSGLKKELNAQGLQLALSAYEQWKLQVRHIADVAVLAVAVPHADIDILRALTDKFRQEYSTGVAVLSTARESGPATLVASVTDDLVKRGVRAADLITAIGGRGGGRPNMAQGSLPDASKAGEALSKVARAVEEKLK